MAKFFVRLLVLLILAAAVLGFFAAVAGAEETVRASCAWVVGVVQFVRGLFAWPSPLSEAQALAGILILLPFLVLIVIQACHWVFHRSWLRRANRVCYSSQGCNGPICAAEDDCLDRGAFVDHLSEVLSGPYVGNDAFYVALYGGWGSGKTSVINLVKEKLKGDCSMLFVDFPSWEHEDRKDVPFVLFAQIARWVWWKLDLPLAVLLFRYAVLLVPRRLIGIAGPVEWVADLLVRLSNVMTSAPELRARIGERLERLKAQIVVVVDDLDRMEADDVRSLLRVIRTTGDISHFVYCILSAREHLERCVEKLYMEDKDASDEKSTGARDMARDYIQKLVNLEIDLPSVDAASLASIFVRRLNAALQSYGEPGIKEDCEAFKLFTFYITTFRAMNRLLNELIVRIGYFHSRKAEDDALPVNLDDLIAISIIHLYDVDFWRRIYDHRDIFIGNDVNAFLDEYRYHAKEMKEKFGLDDAKRGEVRMNFLSNYLDVTQVETSDAADFQVRIDQREAECGRHLKSARCFKSYFDGLVPTLAGVGFIRGVMERLGDEDGLLKYLLMQNERGVLIRCLDYLEVVDPILEPEKRQVYLRALVRLAELKLEPEEPVWRDPLGISAMFDPVTHIIRCVTFMLQKLYPEQPMAVGAELMGVFRSLPGVVAMAQMIRSDNREGGPRHYDYRFSDDDYHELVKLFLDRIKELQRTGTLVDHWEEEELRRTWRVLLRQNRVENEAEELSDYRELLKKDARAFPQVLHVLLPYRYYGSRAIEDAVPMYFKEIDEDFGVETVRSALISAEKGPLKDTAKQILANLDWCVKEHSEKGAWPHPDNQMEGRD